MPFKGTHLHISEAVSWNPTRRGEGLLLTGRSGIFLTIAVFSFLFHTLVLGVLIVQTSPIPFVLSSTDCIQ
jgi:hypothetical protein